MAANTFFRANFYECVNEAYKLLIPILEARRDYKKLKHVHQTLSETFNKIVNTVGDSWFPLTRRLPRGGLSTFIIQQQTGNKFKIEAEVEIYIEMLEILKTL